MTDPTHNNEPVPVEQGARVYIAARFSRRHEANALGHILKAHGCVITSRWTLPEAQHVLPSGLSRQAEDAERQRFALEDVEDVRAADWTISLMEEPRSNGRGGRHVEFGLAVAFAHRLTIIGPRETVFHHLPNVEYFDTVEDFTASLPPHVARHRLASATQPPARERVPAGWKLVPVEPTEAMIHSWGCASLPYGEWEGMDDDAVEAACAKLDWSAMLAPSPAPPATGGER